MTDKAQKKIKLTLLRSGVRFPERQGKTLKGLGLKKVNGTKILNDTPAIRGMISKVAHLVSVEDCR